MGQPKLKKKERGGVIGLIGMIFSMLAFVAWALYSPFSFHAVGSLLCLAVILPISLIFVILGIVLCAIALKIGPGKRKWTAIVGLLLGIVMVLLWIGWIVFTTFWNIGVLE